MAVFVLIGGYVGLIWGLGPLGDIGDSNVVPLSVWYGLPVTDLNILPEKNCIRVFRKQVSNNMIITTPTSPQIS